MGINRVFKLLIVFVFLTSFLSCKGGAKNNNDVIVNNTSSLSIEKEDNPQTKIEPKDFILEFYTKYIKYLEDPLNEESIDYEFYLTEDLIDKIGKAKGYDYIINAQDSTIEWLKTLKVEDTEKNNVYSVSYEKGYYDSDDNIIYATVVELEKGKFRISKLSSSLIDQPISTPLENEGQKDKFTYYAFEYKINPGEYNEEINYFIDYLEEDYIVFQITDPDKFYDYKCRQERVKDGVLLYYVDVGDEGNEEYTGDTSKPLMKIYKKVNDFYAKSSLIDNGKEVKLKEVESRY
ncbi:hypothetical protein H0I25_10490 [Cellulophaga sp. HaHa_2_95]|uniref:hypothetical protein n=1 Tax=Cellulophaga TaxID=104264 RepID=UPI001C4E5919|nr:MULTISPECIES: hypothetical protein [Cellulophaga]MCR1024161.1 hypothetical protein [Cellulophaga baltica]QXP54515.1 hypothetical protein H0I25_10490 [Cellulophaga sp. HaHa_2_95]